VLTEDKFKSLLKASIADPTGTADPAGIAEDHGPFRKMFQKSAAVHFAWIFTGSSIKAAGVPALRGAPSRLPFNFPTEGPEKTEGAESNDGLRPFTFLEAKNAESIFKSSQHKGSDNKSTGCFAG